MPCFSARSVGKKGGFQAELRYALDCARRIPLDGVYLSRCVWTTAKFRA